MNVDLNSWRLSLRQASQGVRLGWRHSTARRLLSAWVTELHGLLPHVLGQRISLTTRTQVMDWPVAEPVDTSIPVVLLLPPDEVLVEQIKLPVAATRHLRQVMAYEIDRFSPFTLDEVIFQSRILRTTAEKSTVELVIIKRDRIDTILEQCSAIGLTVLKVHPLNEDEEIVGVDLLPEKHRPRSSASANLNKLLVGLAGVLLVALALLVIHSREAQIDAMQTVVSEQRRQAQEIQEARQELVNTQGAASYLARLKLSKPTVTQTLLELTNCLGEDTWLEQMELADNGDLTLSGQSQHASGLITRSKTCGQITDVQFRGVIQPDPQTGSDRFSLAVKLKQEAVDAPTAEY